MALPIDAIVVTYYSGSVNIASTNSQSLFPNMAPCQLLLTEQGPQLKNRDKRLFQRLDNVFAIPGIGDVIAIYELLAHKVIPSLTTQTITISESQRRKAGPKIAAETITILDSIKRLISRTIADSESISDLVRKLSKRPIGQTVTVAESVLRKAAPKMSSQAIAISDAISRPFTTVHVAQSISISEVLKKVPKRPLAHTIAIVENTVRRGITLKPFVETAIAISDSWILKIIPLIAGESIAISQVFSAIKARLFLNLAGSVAISDSNTRLLKARRTLIEGRASILFNGLGPP